MNNFLIFFLFLIHPIYISSSKIIIINDTAEVNIKIFRDDLEDDLRLFYNKSISIDNIIKLQNASSQIDTYIQNKFELRIDNSKIKLFEFKYNLINDLVEISCSFDFKKDFNEINIINNILFEVYKIQKNVVFINVEKQSKSHIFSFSDREKTFSY
ncbi:MAG: DUF6702 family protein [Cytophagales bacterium]